MSETQWSTRDSAILPSSFAKRLRAVTEEFRKKGKAPNLLAQIMFQVAKVPELRAKALAPSKTGRLRNAIRKRRDRNPAFVNSTENYQVYVNTGRTRADKRGAWYWTFVHFPTEQNQDEKNKDPVPFLTIAFESTKAEMLAVFRLQFKKKLELAEKKVKKIK